MYAYIKGKLKSKTEKKVVVENSGIGYELHIGSVTYNDLPLDNEEVMLYTFHHVREDREELYGFSTDSEKKLFEVLLSMSSIGPSKALGILSQIAPSRFVSAVIQKDVMTIASLKGVGKKTAERILLDLRNKVLDIKVDVIEYGQDFKNIEDALGGLVSLGFKENKAREMLQSVRDDLNKDDKTQDIIKKALRKSE